MLANQSAHRFSRFRTLLQPVLKPLGIDSDFGRLGQRIVRPDVFDETAVPGRLRRSHHDLVKRSLFPSTTSQTNTNCHDLYLTSRFKKSHHPGAPPGKSRTPAKPSGNAQSASTRRALPHPTDGIPSPELAASCGRKPDNPAQRGLCLPKPLSLAPPHGKGPGGRGYKNRSEQSRITPRGDGPRKKALERDATRTIASFPKTGHQRPAFLVRNVLFMPPPLSRGRQPIL